MKKIQLFSLALLLSLQLAAIDDNKSDNTSSEDFKKEFQAHPLSFFFSGFEIGGEFVTSPKKTVKGSVGYFTSYNAVGYDRNRYSNLDGFRAEFQRKFYSNQFSARNNYYFGLFGVFKTIAMDHRDRMTNDSRRITSSAVSLGIVLGYRVRLMDFLSMDMHLGGGLTPTSIGDYELIHIDQVNPYEKSINLKLGVTFGIRI
jgi:hypothetical protein